MPAGFNPRPTDPTPEQIRQRCLEIQEEWTEAERLARAGNRSWLRKGLEPTRVRTWLPRYLCDIDTPSTPANDYSG